MPLFIRLANLTEQGVQNIGNAPEILAEAKEIMAKEGARIVHAYATLGRYDVVAVIEAPDEKAAIKVSALIGAKGNIRAETLPAIPVEEFIESVKS